MTLEEETAVDEKISGMNKEEMQTRFDELEDKEELTESEEYEYGELEDRLDIFEDTADIDTEEADKDN